jgi:hypothetical protein
MIVLFRPHLEALLTHRDSVCADWARAHPDTDALEDRQLEVTGFLPISVEETVRAVRSLAGRPQSGITGRTRPSTVLPSCEVGDTTGG